MILIDLKLIENFLKNCGSEVLEKQVTLMALIILGGFSEKKNKTKTLIVFGKYVWKSTNSPINSYKKTLLKYHPYGSDKLSVQKI